MAEPKDFSEHTARLIDEEVQRMTQEMEAKAESLLKSHREHLDRLADALLEHETLDYDEVNRVLGLNEQDSSAEAA
jgi:cell division protease FtsH